MTNIKDSGKLAERERDEKWMEQFPSKNPNPVLRVGNDGAILYANPASIPILERWGVSPGEKLPGPERGMVIKAALLKSPQKLELKAGEKIYLISINPLPEEEYINLYGFDITSQKQTEEQLRMREKQHLALNRLGKMAFDCEDLQTFMDESTGLIARTLELKFCKILELKPEGNFLLRAGVGWKPGLVGRALVEGKRESQAGYTLLSNKPVIVEDMKKESRFAGPSILTEHGVVSGMSVIIGDVKKPFGVIGVHSREKRKFSREDIYFLSSAALLTAEVIERKNAEEEVKRHREHLEEMVGKRTLELTNINLRLEKEIAERKQAEKILQKSEERYRTAAVQTGQLVYDYDIITGEIDWAGAIIELTGYSPEEFRGFTPEVWAEHIHPEDRKKYLEAHKKCLKTGKNFHEEYRLRKKDGSYFYVEDNGVYLKGEDREIYRVIGTIKDISERKRSTEILRKSEERYRIAAEQTGQIVYDYDLETGLVDWAGAITELTGYSPEEFRKFNPEIWMNHLHPRDQERVMESVRRSFESGERIREEFRFRRKDGTYVYVEDSGVFLKDEKGKEYRLIGVMKDITERKLAQEKLEKSESRYRIAAEQTGQIVFDYEKDTGKVDWAGAIKELTGYSTDEFQSFDRAAWEEHIHPEDRKRVEEELSQEEELSNSGEKVKRFLSEYRVRRKDRSYFYVEESGIYLKDRQNRIRRVVGVMKDTTEKKLAVEKLRESEERYRSFVQNFMGIAFQEDTNFVPMFLHGAVREITGYGEEDFLSEKQKWEKILQPEDLPSFLENRAKLRASPGLPVEHDYRIRRRDGKIRWVHEIIQKVSDVSGKKEFYQGSIYDITARKAVEEALAKAEEVRKKEIHHRIKNNLQVISSLLSLQAEKFSDEKVQEAFRESQNRVISMSLIHEELYKSKDMENLDFSAYLKKLTSDLLRSYRVRSDEISLKLDVDEVLFGMDTAIPLGIITNELVSNSLKHAFPDGGGEIRIELRKMLQFGEDDRADSRKINKNEGSNKAAQFSLVVSDNGLGFPENIDFRNTTSLGLQLVNTLVEQIGGNIELERKPATRFVILFRENS